MKDATTPETAQAIYQDLLDVIGSAVEARDCSAYIDHFSLPHALSGADGTLLIVDHEQLCALFAQLCAKLDRENVRGLTRVCTVASFVDDNTIRGSHDTWLVTDAAQIRQTYVALSTLRRVEGRWLVADSQYDGSGRVLPLDIIKQFEVPEQP